MTTTAKYKRERIKIFLKIFGRGGFTFLLPLILFILSFLFSPTSAEAASRFWVGGTGNWSDTAHWSDTSGGSGGFSKPTTGDVVTLNASSGGGTVTADEAIIADSITMGAFTGILDTNGQTVTLQNLSITGTGARTLTLGASAINLSLAGTCWDATTVTNLTVTTNTATVTCSGAGASFTSATKDYSGMTLVMSGSGTATIGTGSITLANLNRTGTAVKTDIFSLSGNLTITGTLTIAGNSSTNRLLVQSNTVGTARTVTAATVSVSNVDFQDIVGAGAGNWDLSSITGLSGDAYGNSGIIFTATSTYYWVGDTGNWSDATQWASSSGGAGGSGRVPLPGDNVIFDNGSFSGTSQTVTLDMPRAGRNIDWSAYNEGQTPTWGAGSVSWSFYGSATLISGMNLGTGAHIYSRGRGLYTLTTAGKNWQYFHITMPGGTLTSQDLFYSTNVLYSENGTFNANNFDVTIGSFNAAASGATRAVNMGSGTWTVTGSSSTVWNTASSLTLNTDTSTLIFNGSGASTKLFEGSDKTYYNVTFAADNMQVSGSNTFNTLAINSAGLTNGVFLRGGMTQTVSNFTTNGSVGNLAKLNSYPTGVATLSKSGGTVSVDYMSIASSTVTGGATWYAGANSTNVGNNTGWTFTAPGSLPTVTVQDASSITNFTATLNGNITDTGGSNPSIRGFEYGTTTSYGFATTTSGSYNTGAFRVKAPLSSLK